MFDINNPFVPQGWQCPICGRVYAPSTPWCYFCGNQETYTTTTTSETITSGSAPKREYPESGEYQWKK